MPYLVTYTTIRPTGRGTLEAMRPQHTMLREHPADWLAMNRAACRLALAGGDRLSERDYLILKAKRSDGVFNTDAG